MTALSPEDFTVFFREINDGLAPFPWQERLARHVFLEHKWPACLDLPTASGKTAVLDIAIFHLALEARRGAERRAPVRIAFVVDRRLIVDQAHERAQRLRDSLKTGNGVVARVANELGFLAGDESDLLTVCPLRGGLPRESDWARTPAQPTILLSTVDQVGSRLLFRGYGVSNSMRPVHAGLLGSDCLIFLDEAHLSEPFRQSLHWVERYRNRPWTSEEAGPWGVITLSATPTSETLLEAPFRLSNEDYEHPVLGGRLNAAKRAELHEIDSPVKAESYANVARELSTHTNIDKVLIVVNRVDLARAIFEELSTNAALLLTGRVREIDRDDIVNRLKRRMTEPGKFFAVATQCIEAGADLDFDGLVTQIAPVDALRQRFGRLNRTGREIQCKAAIVAAKEDLPTKKPDPIYGFAAREAWDLLRKIGDADNKRRFVDFGSLSLAKKLAGQDITAACSESLNAPVMVPGYVDLWACTNPPPSLEPDVSLFLHGAERASADVEIVWRADIVQDDLVEPVRFGRLLELIALVPPRSGETLAVPIWKTRAWLYNRPDAAAFGDLEGEREASAAISRERGRSVLRWRGADDPETKVISPAHIRPGDVIIVPASYGGSDEWGWSGRIGQDVTDRALEAAARVKPREIAIRLHRNLLPVDLWVRVSDSIDNYFEDPRQLSRELANSGSLPAQYKTELAEIGARTEDVEFIYDEERPSVGVILTGYRRKDRRAIGEASTESDRIGSFGEEVELSAHTASVVVKARQFGERAGFADRIRRAIEFAAELHDAGKGDRRFQAFLRNGREGSEILAKSGQRPAGNPNREFLPERWRHEALSVRVAIGHSRFSAESEIMDQGLALWLIGTHHGWGRPFFPHDDRLDDCARQINGGNGELVFLNAAPGPQRLDFNWNGIDWATLFDLLHHRYGAWELARIEATLRLADHRASEEDSGSRARAAGS